jgi:hypothetical protein
VRALFELSPRGPDDGPAGGDQSLIAATIGFERLLRAVGPPAVGLDHDPPVGPGEVGLDRGLAVAGVDPELDLRVGEAEGTGEGQEGFLEVVLGRGAPDVVVLEDVADPLGAGASWVAGELVIDLVQVKALNDLGLVEGALELALVDEFGQVEQGAGDRGHGDVVDDGCVCFGEGR